MRFQLRFLQKRDAIQVIDPVRVKYPDSFPLRDEATSDNSQHPGTLRVHLSNNSFQVNTESRSGAGSMRDDRLRPWLPFLFAATAYLALLVKMDVLLRDSDLYWHIVVGQWIIDHRAVPYVDPFSFTMRGEHWITSAWLSEVLYFAAFRLAGWAGPVVLAALSASAAFLLLTILLLKRLPNIPVMILVSAGIAMAANHMLARPHILVFPLLVLWANALVQATEERRAPSVASLPLMTLWANLHGSFTLGLALIAPFALEALTTADRSARLTTVWLWLRFGVLAAVAACITPYGPESIFVTFRILNLGATLSNIGEWAPTNFGRLSPFTICFLAGAAYVLYSGFKLPPVRLATLLALIYETLAHVRYVDVSALVTPLLVAAPLGRQLSWSPVQQGRTIPPVARTRFVSAVAALVVATGPILATVTPTPPLIPRVAVEKLRDLKADRILNDYYFGGYLIFLGIPTFIDSRAELYGPAFLSRYQRAISLDDVADFVRLLDEYKIDATLLFPSTQAVGLLDRLPDWERAYADAVAIVHVRRTHPESAHSPNKDHSLN